MNAKYLAEVKMYEDNLEINEINKNDHINTLSMFYSLSTHFWTTIFKR